MARPFALTRRRLARGLTMLLLPAAMLLQACDPATLGLSGTGGAGGPVKVAILVPSGAADPQINYIGDSLARAANMAVTELGGGLVTVKTYSTAGDQSLAVAVAQQAVNEGADVILGPLFAQNAAAVGRAVAGSGKAVIAFSNDTSIAGGNVLVLGHTFENTAAQLGAFSARQGKRNVMIINARSAREESIRQSALAGLAGTGVQVVATADFEPSQEGLTAAMPNIAATAQSAGAQALMLTSDTEVALPALTGLLPDYGLPPASFQYIGLTRWDQPASAPSLPGLQGGWFAMPEPTATQQFSSRLSAASGRDPHFLGALAYDGIAAIAAQAKRAGKAGVSAQAMIRAGDFSGATGVFRFLSNGTNRRGLAIASIRNNSVVILQHAPTRLGSAGF